MLQITPHMRILVAIGAVDFRRGIDGLAQLCRAKLGADPFSGAIFVFRNQRGTSIKALAYDGQGYWLCQKRLSQGRFRWWPSSENDAVTPMQAHELQVLLYGGDPSVVRVVPVWRRVGTEPEHLL